MWVATSIEWLFLRSQLFDKLIAHGFLRLKTNAVLFEQLLGLRRIKFARIANAYDRQLPPDVPSVTG